MSSVSLTLLLTLQAAGRKKFRGSKLIVDDKNQRLFVEDGERILIFDINPNWLEDYPEASHVIGQAVF